MERLTIKCEELFVPKKTCTTDRFGEVDDCDPCDTVCKSDCRNCAIQECFTRLGEYENTGLTPEPIRELKERDTAKAPIDADEDYGFFTCPSCGEAIYASDDFKSHKFCLNCGQRIRWED